MCLLSESGAEASVRDVHGCCQPNPGCSVVPTSPARRGVRPWGGQGVLACPAWLVGQRAPWGPDRGCGAWTGIAAAAAGDAASKRLGLCWVGMAKGGETSLGGGDGGERPLPFSGRRVLSLPGVKSSLRPRRGRPRQPRDGTRQRAAPGSQIPSLAWYGLRYQDDRRLSQWCGHSFPERSQPGGHLARELPGGPALQLLLRLGSPGLRPLSPARWPAAAEGDRAGGPCALGGGRWPSSPGAGAAVFVANICLRGSSAA